MNTVHDVPKRRVGRPNRAEASRTALAKVDWSQFDPIAVLRRIAADESAPSSSRVAACRVLLGLTRGGEDAAAPTDAITKRALDLMASKGVATEMTMDDIPIVEMYRGVGLHDFQSRERISAIVKPAIDAVFEMPDPVMLFGYLKDTGNPPEGRLFARAKLRALGEISRLGHGRAAVDLAVAEAFCAGLRVVEWADPDAYGSLLDLPGSPAPRPVAHRSRLLVAQGEQGA